jgi:hypothetical protein
LPRSPDLRSPYTEHTTAFFHRFPWRRFGVCPDGNLDDTSSKVAMSQPSDVTTRRRELSVRKASKTCWRYQVKGKPPVTLEAGEALFIAAGTARVCRPQ